MKNTDMTQGSIFKHIIRFTIPLILSGILQVFYGMADTAVVGKFVGADALAAVGSSLPIINMIINVFFGLGSATTIIVAQRIGAGDKNGVKRAVHTSLISAVILGAALAILGICLAKPLLLAVNVPRDVIGLSSVYVRVYFLAMPVMLLFNFGSAALNAAGDSMRSTKYGIIAGALNVVFNLIFVIVFRWGVAGVAVATLMSQTLSCALTIRCLMKRNDSIRLDVKELKIHKKEMKELVRLGVPAGFQTTMISASTVIVQTSVNSCGSVAMAGNSVAYNIEGMVYIAILSFFQTAVTFISQNYGAQNFKRIRRGYIGILSAALAFAAALSMIILWFSPKLLTFYTDSAAVSDFALMRLRIVLATYFLSAISEVTNGAMRGLGSVNKAMVITLLGDCGIRLFINFLGAPYNKPEDLKFLFWSSPIAWVVTGVILMVMFIFESKKHKRRV